MDHQLDKSALLVMDLEREVVEHYVTDTSLLERLRGAIETARTVGIPVIFVRLAFRPGHPDVSPRNRAFAPIASLPGGGFGEDDEATQFHPALGARPDDAVVIKRRASAFTGSDLEVLLRSMGITHLVLAGVATSGVVLRTLLEAADRDYGLTVLSDGCEDPDEELQRVLMEKIFPSQAEVLTVAEWAMKHSKTSGN